MTTFRNLNVYIKSKELVKQIYELLKKFPKEEQFALCDQLRRAVISIPSNIAEGSGRNSQKDQAHFYNIAYGSLMEVVSQLQIAMDLGEEKLTEVASRFGYGQDLSIPLAVSRSVFPTNTIRS